ncbi:MAG: phosphopantothenoylcysteine synthetase/decarboxylase [Bacteroidia bacterium]
MIGPENGELASGLTGLGRMTEPQDIITAIL